MKSELRRVSDTAWSIIAHPHASRLEKIEALKLIAACKGVLLPDINEQFLTAKQVAQLRIAKRTLVEKALKRKERKRKANRKQYVRRRLKALEPEEDVGDTGEEQSGQNN